MDLTCLNHGLPGPTNAPRASRGIAENATPLRGGRGGPWRPWGLHLCWWSPVHCHVCWQDKNKHNFSYRPLWPPNETPMAFPRRRGSREAIARAPWWRGAKVRYTEEVSPLSVHFLHLNSSRKAKTYLFCTCSHWKVLFQYFFTMLQYIHCKNIIFHNVLQHLYIRMNISGPNAKRCTGNVHFFFQFFAHRKLRHGRGKKIKNKLHVLWPLLWWIKNYFLY